VKKTYLYVLIVLILTGANSCSENPAEDAQKPVTAQAQKTQPASPQCQIPPAGHTGTVVETMNTAGYTYVSVDTGKETIWAATPECAVKKGDRVTVPQGMPMKNYHSKTLDRTFETVFFVSGISVEGARQKSDNMTSWHQRAAAPKKGEPVSAGVDFSGIQKPSGGKTVAEIYAEKDGLAGKQIMVRARVVKFNRNIMKKNWLHIQDGSGTPGTKDLTVTTSATAAVGDIVLVKGVLSLNKDFGFGYKYSAIIEDATITVEKSL